MKLDSDNFSLKEWATNKIGVVYPTPEREEMVEGLEMYKQAVADKYNKDIEDVAVLITDGDRLGNSGSMHNKGKASDIFTILTDEDRSLSSAEQMKIIEDLDIFTGRGLYPFNKGFIHVDIRDGLYPDKEPLRWYRDKQGEYHYKNNDYTKSNYNGYLGG